MSDLLELQKIKELRFSNELYKGDRINNFINGCVRIIRESREERENNYRYDPVTRTNVRVFNITGMTGGQFQQKYCK